MKLKYTVWILILLSLTSYGQNVGIGTSSPGALLDVSATNNGILIPRVALTATTSASPLISPATSTMVYNTATATNVTPGYYYWSGTAWIRLIDNASIGGATTIGNTSSANNLSTTVNGVTGTSVPIINSNILSLTGNTLTSTVNGIAPTQSLSGLSLSGDVTGTLAASTVGKIQGAGVAFSSLVSNNLFQYNGTNWVNVTPASILNAATTHTLSLSGNTLISTVNSVAPTQSLSGLTLTGDVTGSLGTDTVARIQGQPVSATAPTAGQVLEYSSGTWMPTSPGSSLFTAGTGLSWSGSTLNSTGVTSFSGGSTGLTPGSATTGAISLGGILGVGYGGTGLNATTAYAILCGGTTATGALQSVSGAGISGQVLVSNGASALPTWQGNTPSAAGTISGTATVCQGQTGVLYTVPAITNATSYTWSYSGTGATIVGSTNAAIIYFSAAATSGNLTVAGTNAFSVSGTASAAYPITVSAIPTITGTTPASRTGDGTVALGATSSAGTINWWAAATGGSSLGTGTSYTTPCLTGTTKYYVDATLNGCTTSSRTAVTATSSKNFQVDNSCTLTTSLVAYYPLSVNSTVNDFWSSNTLGNTGSVIFNATGKVENTSATFISPNQYLLTSPLSTQLTNVSIFLWVYINSASQSGVFFLNGNATTSFTNGFSLGVGGTNLCVSGGLGNQLIGALFGVAWMPFGTNIGTGWHLVGMENNAGTWTGYIDNVACVNTYAATARTPTSYFAICSVNDLPDCGVAQQGFTGEIEELGFWNKALSAQERTDLYNGGAGQTMH